MAALISSTLLVSKTPALEATLLCEDKVTLSVCVAVWAAAVPLGPFSTRGCGVPVVAILKPAVFLLASSIFTISSHCARQNAPSLLGLSTSSTQTLIRIRQKVKFDE